MWQQENCQNSLQLYDFESCFFLEKNLILDRDPAKIQTMSQTFLLADDDSDDHELFQAALAEINRSIVFDKVLDGLQLINQLLEKNQSKPDIIFLDLNMPLMNGWRCLEALKGIENTKDIPVIIYSTSDQQLEEKKAEEMGALCFLKKPASFKTLINILSVVSDHLRGGSLVNLRSEIRKLA
jgi:CheY-like chemotaxis protein